jgi:molecular chaperone DnaK
MIEADVTKSLGHLAAALAAAEADHGIGPAGVDQVLLAGGSARIPSIRDRLAGFFGLGADDIRADLDPDELNARGAGLIAREYEPAVTFEEFRPGLLGANLRLRAEMADPALDRAGSAAAAGLPDVLPAVPAETPADFRPVADASRLRLAASRDGELSALRAAYAAFVAAIHAAAPDEHLHELGEALAREYTRA